MALFRVGRADTCALRLEGESAKFASWEHAELRVDDEGRAYVTDLGSSNGTYVDGVRIAEATRLHVGMTVQIGTKGPRFDVLELGRAASQAPVAVAQAAPIAAVSTARPAARPAANWRPAAIAVALGVTVCALLAITLRRKGDSPPLPVAQHPSDQASVIPSPTPGPPDPKPNAASPATPTPVPKPLPSGNPAGEPPAGNPPLVSPSTPADPWIAAKQAGMAAYRMIAVEDPKSKNIRPFAGSVLVGAQTLLTTADVGVELADLVARGWRAKAVRDSQDAGVAIGRVRVLAAFQGAKPEEQLFFDLALVELAERADGAIALATPDELAVFEQMQPLMCLAVSHAGDPFNRFEELRPEAAAGKVFMEKRLSAEKDTPRVLFLRGAFGENVQGSPIVDPQGHLVALYCERAPVEEGKSVERANHYAVIVEPDRVKPGLEKSDHPDWVAPTTPPQPVEKEEATQ